MAPLRVVLADLSSGQRPNPIGSAKPRWEESRAPHASVLNPKVKLWLHLLGGGKKDAFSVATLASFIFSEHAALSTASLLGAL